MLTKRFRIPLLFFLCVSCLIIGMIIASKINIIPAGIASPEKPEIQEQYRGISHNTFVNIAKKFNPSVVYISSTQIIKGPQGFQAPFEDPFRDFFGDDFFDRFFNMPKGDLKQQSLGSGFIIDKEGYILTNNHVVMDAKEILVTLSDENEYKAKVIGNDEDMDVALLKVDAKEDLPAVNLGDSDALQVGEWVVAIGNPFGLEHTVTAGIVSAKWRSISEGPYSSFIQTDASINPGNSGGPLFNINGEVVGINTAIVAEGQGIGFAIPINMVKEVLHDLKHEGKIRRGWLGLMIQKVTPDLAKSFGLKEHKGALVSEVVEGGPADDAGIKRGDVIVRFNEKEIKEYTDLSRYAGLTKPGTRVTVELIRDGKKVEVMVNLGQFERGAQAIAEEKEETILGMAILNITPELAQHFDMKQSEGVIVVDVKPDTPADRAGIQKGDVILEVDRKKVSNIREFQDAITRSSGETILLLISREGHLLYIPITK